MTDLTFTCVDVRPEPYGTSPTLVFRLRIEADDRTARIHAVALRCQLRIEPAQRPYTPDEMEMLGDLFGEPERWSTTVKPLQFAHASVTVPGFTGAIEIELPVVCTYDTEVASAGYFRALADGEIPLLLLFSGTVFSGDRGFVAEPVPWHKETAFRMPVKVWQNMIEQYFPGSGWLRVRDDCLDALRRFRSARALPSWERTFEELLRTAADHPGGTGGTGSTGAGTGTGTRATRTGTGGTGGPGRGEAS